MIYVTMMIIILEIVYWHWSKLSKFTQFCWRRKTDLEMCASRCVMYQLQGSWPLSYLKPKTWRKWMLEDCLVRFVHSESWTTLFLRYLKQM